MKTKQTIFQRILGLALALVLAVGLFPITAYAVIEGEGWYISDEDVLVVTGKLTALPSYGYESINVTSFGELAFAESETWGREVFNTGTISGGKFTGALENQGTISGGTFTGTVKQQGTISGGTFQTPVENTGVARISGGTFMNSVTNYGTIQGGDFREEVKNGYNGIIDGGTFLWIVTNDHYIRGGTFQSLVTNNGLIGGGTFQNGVGNNESGTIDGGTFSFYVNNRGTVVKVKLLEATVVGNAPQSVIHRVEGEDKALAYGNPLLGELGAVREGTAWYAGDTCVSGGTVPFSYTEYTLRPHTHSYVYTVSGNVLTETCEGGCDHVAKATLTVPQKSYAYTGDPIMPARIVFDENWKGSKGNGYRYTSNVEVGTATVTADPAGETITATFEITAADVAGAQLTFSREAGEYDGTVQPSPTTVLTWNWMTLAEGIDYTLSWDRPVFKDAGVYTVTVTGRGNFVGELKKTFTILPKEIGIRWGGTNFMSYTGQLVLPVANATGLIEGDRCDVIVSLVETTEGAGINPGKWTARITGLSNGNYKLPENSSVPLEVPYTIYAWQAAPSVSGIAETVKGKNDGRISGLTIEMEYATLPTNLNHAYTKITDPNMLFAPGTYYVRYAAKDYYYSSSYTEVTIAEGDEPDVIAPVFYGIEDGGVYYGDKTFKATDEHFLKIEVDGVDITDTTEGDNEYTILADNAAHTVTATDRSNNATEYTITVYKRYTVTYKADGKTLSTETVGHGNSVTLPPVPEKDGYSGKWDYDGSAIEGDLAITAIYTAIPPIDSPHTADGSPALLWWLSATGGLLLALTGLRRKTTR